MKESGAIRRFGSSKTDDTAGNEEMDSIQLLVEEDSINDNDKASTTLTGLAVAGWAASLLTSIFGLFHVQVFLNAYQLDTKVYSWGNLFYSVINAANDVAGAWVMDHVAVYRKRSDLVGAIGVCFSLCFLAPFFRPWRAPWNPFMDGLHFVLSMSLYDTLYSFAMILYGSIVSDDHEMTQDKRVRFMAVCKVINLVASLAVTRVGLYLFHIDNLYHMQCFLLVLVLIAMVLSVVAQGLIHGKRGRFWLQDLVPRKANKAKEPSPTKPLQWQKVVADFWSHKNFRAWIGMEMLMEAQTSFQTGFRKTFVDQLLIENGVNKELADWTISMLRPLTSLVSLLMFVPIRTYGYPTVYRCLFVSNFIFSLALLLFANAKSTGWIAFFLIVYPTMSTAVASAGFGLAMADLVLDMKYSHARNGRFDEPSLAAMFMGANALFCKPMESVLPVVAAQAMNTSKASDNLYYVLVLPPLVFSLVQLFSWKNYTLEPTRVSDLRHELIKILETDSGV